MGELTDCMHVDSQVDICAGCLLGRMCFPTMCLLATDDMAVCTPLSVVAVPIIIRFQVFIEKLGFLPVSLASRSLHPHCHQK